MSAAFLRKYGVPVSGVSVISIPLIKADVTNYAVSADWTPVAGDVVVSRDGGTTFSNIANLPIARTAGNAAVWDFMLIGTETQAAQTRVMISDAATKAVEDDYFIVEFFGNISGMHRVDYTTLSQDANGYLYSDTAAWSGSVLPNQTTAGIPDINVKNILGTQSSGLGGFVGIDWSNIAQKSSTVNLNNTAISGISYYTGNTPQTGDSYSRIGNGGINLTSVAVSSVIGNIAGNINGNVLGYVNVSGIQGVVASGLANTILSQSVLCTENTSPSGSLTEVILQSVRSSVSGSTLQVKRSDGTNFSTKTLVLDSQANPIRGIS
jgi:hypothetical protein